MTMQTLAQKRANFALAEVSAEKSEKFANFSAGAPAMILQNGLGQALSFWLAKHENHHQSLFEMVRKWLVNERKLLEGADASQFLKALFGLDQSRYLEVQNETLRLLEWIKRFAKALA